MTDYQDDYAPMLFGSIKRLRSKARSTSLSLPSSFDNEGTFMSHTGPLHPQRETVSGPSSKSKRLEMGHWKHEFTRIQSGKHLGNSNYPRYGTDVKRSEHLMMSGPLGSCNDPDCTECPSTYKTKSGLQSGSITMDKKLHDILYGKNDSWTKKWASRLDKYLPIMNPHTKVVQWWNKFFLFSCFVAIFIDPLFFFLLSLDGVNKCIVFNWSLATTITIVRSVTDFMYLLNMILQFRLAYVAPESRVVGAGDLVDQPKKIALNYLHGYFFVDFFIFLPLPQVMILAVLPSYMGSSKANYAKNLLRVTVLLQYIPRLIRFVPLLGGQSASGFILESAWANFVINLLMFVLAGHVVGSCWYLFGLQRVNQCLQEACDSSNVTNCRIMIDCGRGGYDGFNAQEDRASWINESTSTSCFDAANGNFNYGIYQNLVLLTTELSAAKRYLYSLYWGFLQISTFAGNQVPSYFPWEVLFLMAIIGLGLLLFALLIGNMQNFLQALGRRRVEMQLRRRDVERWMSHRRLPEALRRKVRQAERFTWAAARGIEEEKLLENLPEGIQREIHRHLFGFLNNVRIFSLMDEPMLDAMYEKLKQKLYVRGSDIFYKGGPVEKMVFVVRGKLESIGADGSIAPLAEGDVCGEELLTWCLENTSVNREGGKIRFHGSRLYSTRIVRCLTNVEAFVLRAADLEEVTALFSRFLRNPRVQGAIRYESPYWRNIAATRIQVAWRYRQKRLTRSDTSNNLI